MKPQLTDVVMLKSLWSTVFMLTVSIKARNLDVFFFLPCLILPKFVEHVILVSVTKWVMSDKPRYVTKQNN